MTKETERKLWQKTPKQLDDGISKPKKKKLCCKNNKSMRERNSS
jgi:hypothetical protein